MILFIIAAGAMTLFALAMMLPVLWRKDVGQVVDQHQANISIAQEQQAQLDAMRVSGELTDEEYTERQAELEMSLAANLNADAQNPTASSLQSSGYIVSSIVALGLPLAAFFLYQNLGAPEALDPEYVAAQQAPIDTNVESIEELLPRLEAHLADNPDDLRGWRLLGVTYLRMQRFNESAVALSNALELSPSDPDILLQLADVKAMVAGGQLQGEPEALIKQALALRPQDLRGMWLMGMLHTQQNDYQSALAIWEKLLPLVQDEPQALREVQQLLQESRSALANASGTENAASSSMGTHPPVGESGQADVTDAAITLEIDLDPAIADKVDAKHNVFIYAKAVSGPPMPLAVLRHKVADLPLQVTLDDSMAMVAGMNLSGFPEVVVGARVSLSGDPVAKSGDFFAEVQPVVPGQQDAVQLTILTAVP